MDSLTNAVLQDGRQTAHRRHPPTLWARRIVGLAIVVSGAALLASDFFVAWRSDQLPSTTAPLARAAA